jgi:hypothetical protein
MQDQESIFVIDRCASERLTEILRLLQAPRQPPRGVMERRHDLDWLRVLLFGLLVLHHVAVGFVAWGADIYRFTNDEVAGDWLGLLIYWTHSWCLPALFLIAGIGTYFATGRSRGLLFLGSRVARLLIPAFVGTFVLNVAAGYAMARMIGEPPGFWTFWGQWLTEPEPRQVLLCPFGPELERTLCAGTKRRGVAIRWRRQA